MKLFTIQRTLWLKYFSNLHLAVDTQSSHDEGLPFNILTTWETPSGSDPLSIV